MWRMTITVYISNRDFSLPYGFGIFSYGYEGLLL